MKNIKLIWVLLSIIGSTIYSIILMVSFDSNSGFSFSFFEKLLFFFVFVFISMVFSLPIVFFERITKIMRLKNSLLGINILFFILALFSLLILYLLNLRGNKDFLFVIVSYVLPGFFLLNWFFKRKR